MKQLSYETEDAIFGLQKEGNTLRFSPISGTRTLAFNLGYSRLNQLCHELQALNEVSIKHNIGDEVVDYSEKSQSNLSTLKNKTSCHENINWEPK